MAPAGIWAGHGPLVLASASAIRRRLLEGAGLPVDVVPAPVDERARERALGPDAAPAAIAETLADAKAAAVAASMPDRVVVGADQVLAFDGRIWPKADSPAEAGRLLGRMAGLEHQLHSAVALLVPGRAPVRFHDTARLTMRDLGPDAVAAYLEVAGPAATRSAGGYEIEGFGIHLFRRIEGDWTTVLGLPLLPLLDRLRAAGLLGW